MTYETFLERLEQAVNQRLEEEEQVERVCVLKNNGLKLDGFSYAAEGRRERPTVYVNQYYRKEMTEEELLRTAALIVRTQRESGVLPQEELSGLLEYENVKDRIYLRLISREKNQELLQEVPYIPLLDLALVFYLQIPEHILKRATALIYERHLKYWGRTLEELRDTAWENMKKLRATLDSVEALLGEDDIGRISGMYVLSTDRKEYGAAVLADPEILKWCSGQLGGDFYILPSSVHELILLPTDTSANLEELRALVREVNTFCVSPEDYLSDQVYCYDSGLQEVKI